MNVSTNEKKPRLLIVDDNRAIHEDFQKILNPDKNGVSDHVLAVEASLFGDDSNKDPACQDCFQLSSAFQGEEAFHLVRQALDQGQPYLTRFSRPKTLAKVPVKVWLSLIQRLWTSMADNSLLSRPSEKAQHLLFDFLFYLLPIPSIPMMRSRRPRGNRKWSNLRFDPYKNNQA